MNSTSVTIRFFVGYKGNLNIEQLKKSLELYLDVLMMDNDIFRDSVLECTDDEIVDFEFQVEK